MTQVVGRPVGSEPVNDEKEDGQINRGSVESGPDKQIGKAQIFRCLLKQWYRPGLQKCRPGQSGRLVRTFPRQMRGKPEKEKTKENKKVYRQDEDEKEVKAKVVRSMRSTQSRNSQL
jgi:hypothetical protein